MPDYDYDFDENMSSEEHGGNAMGQGFDPIPEDNYDLVCHSAEWKDTKNEDDKNAYLKIQWRVIGHEEFNNRVIFEMLHLINTSDKAQKAAQASVRQIMDSAGWDEKRSPKGNEFPGLVVRAHVVLGDKYNGKFKNVIKEYISGATATAPVKTESKGEGSKDGSQPW